MKKTSYIPEGYHTVTPYLYARGASDLIDFLERAFGATRLERLDRPDGTVMHATVRIGNSPVMISEACEETQNSPTSIFLYVEEADSVYKKAVDTGAASVMEPADMFWGDRMAGVKDNWGNSWWLGTHIEDVSPEEIEKRAQACMEQEQKKQNA